MFCLRQTTSKAYTGQIILPDLDLYYYKARIYAPRIGRFLQTDPIGYEDQINLYAYVRNDPLNAVDQNGLQTMMIPAEGSIYHRMVDDIGNRNSLQSQIILNAPITGDIVAFGEFAAEPTLLGGIGVGVGLLSGIGDYFGRLIRKFDGPTEVFYRTMSDTDFRSLQETGILRGTNETFITRSSSYASNYNGTLVEFQVRGGTTNSLASIGVRDNSAAVSQLHGNLPQVQKGWTVENAFFKGEGGEINIGLGQGKALDVFNDNILNFREFAD